MNIRWGLREEKMVRYDRLGEVENRLRVAEAKIEGLGALRVATGSNPSDSGCCMPVNDGCSVAVNRNAFLVSQVSRTDPEIKDLPTIEVSASSGVNEAL